MKSTAKFLLAALAFLLSGMPIHAGITAIKDGNNLKIAINGKPFTEYRTDKWIPCLYPLMSPDGTHLTRRFPFEKDVPGEEYDHPHHIGFWFTHGTINDSDFWHGGQDGSKVVTKGFVGEPVIEEIDADTASLTFTVDLEWIDKHKTPILSEQRTYKIQTAGKNRSIAVTCDLKAINGNVVFGDTKEGSFAIRVAPTLRNKGKVAKGSITTSEGLTAENSWGKRANWVAFHGPDSAGTPTVIALMDHTKNLRNPTWWHARDYGLLAANPFGARGFKDNEFKGGGEFTLKNGESLKQNYLLILHQGDLASAKLEEAWINFNK